MPPSASNFESFLEPGIRELVVTVVKEWQCVTYTSCEGHYDGGAGIASLATVGFLPLNDAEHERLLALSRALATSVNRQLPAKSACRVEAGAHLLDASAGQVPVVEVRFAPSGEWPAYFAALPSVIGKAVAAATTAAAGAP